MLVPAEAMFVNGQQADRAACLNVRGELGAHVGGPAEGRRRRQVVDELIFRASRLQAA